MITGPGSQHLQAIQEISGDGQRQFFNTEAGLEKVFLWTGYS